MSRKTPEERTAPAEQRVAASGESGQHANGSRGSLAHEGLDIQEGWRLRAEEVSERVCWWIQHRPGVALLVAAGLGFGVARLLSRR